MLEAALKVAVQRMMILQSCYGASKPANNSNSCGVCGQQIVSEEQYHLDDDVVPIVHALFDDDDPDISARARPISALLAESDPGTSSPPRQCYI